MKLAIMQPYILPYIGYFQLINAVDKFLYLDNVNYIKKGWINRNKITLNGKEHLFTIPLDKPSQNKLICNTNLHPMDFHAWREKFIRTLAHAYKDTPNFKHFYGGLCSILIDCRPSREYPVTLTGLCNSVNRYIMEALGITTEAVYASNYETGEGIRGEDRIIRLCLLNKADHYINAIGGKDLYYSSNFENKGMRLSFIKCGIEKTEDFNPYMSILDLLFKYPTCAVKEMLYNYSLVQNG